jgi:hypothetical protein
MGLKVWKAAAASALCSRAPSREGGGWKTAL